MFTKRRLTRGTPRRLDSVSGEGTKTKTKIEAEENKTKKEAEVEGTKTKTKIEAEENKTKKEAEVEGTKPKKEVGDEKTQAEKETGGERQEDVETEEPNPPASRQTDPYFSEELFEDFSLLQPFFDSCFVIESEKEDSHRNPVAPCEQEVCLKPRIVPSDHVGVPSDPVEAGGKRCVY